MIKNKSTLPPPEEIFVKLRWGIENLSHKQKLICSYLINNYSKVAFWTVEELSKNSGISPATIIRTSKSLGYLGYREMLMDFERMMVTKNTSLWWEIEKSITAIKKENTLVWVTQDNVDAIRSGITPLLLEHYQSAVDILISANRIHIVAVRSSRAVGVFFYTMLSQFLSNISIISNGIEEAYEDVIDLTPNDLLVVVSLGGPHFATTPIELIRYANARKVKTLLITNDPVCPAVEYASAFVCVGQAKEHYSLVPTMTLIESLIVDLGRKKKQEAQLKLKELAKILREQKINL
ncbi:MAG: MurR/RpiR family transcriptional regulator [Synergistaceae bacterium]|nr:MurR/RpiR family transcriptional regulator [Synergistaceae bacterium]